MFKGALSLTRSCHISLCSASKGLSGILLTAMPRRSAQSGLSEVEFLRGPLPSRASHKSRREGRSRMKSARERMTPGSIALMVLLGVVMAMFFQPRHSLSEVADLAATVASSAGHKASGFFRTGAADISPYSDHFDEVENMWMAANKAHGGSLKYPTTQAHKFESKRWYSERLHPTGLGIRSSWIRVLSGFMRDLPISAFAAHDIVAHFKMNANNVQDNCVLVRIADGKATFEKSFPDARHGRYTSVVYMITNILSEKAHGIPDMTFLVMLNDGHNPHVPTFGAARHWDSWQNLIPAPLGNVRGENEGWGSPLEGWDQYIAETVKDKRVDYPWDEKIRRAVFRGALQMQTYKLGSCNVQNRGKCERATAWDQVNRGVMYKKAQRRPDLFDVTFTKVRPRPGAGFRQLAGAPKAGEGIPFAELQKYKYVINAGSNQDWAERLRSHLFMNSAVVMHEAETKEFYTPLLEPWRHVIPTNLMFTDLVRNVKWAAAHDEEVRKIVQNMNQFAEAYLSERAMKMYWKLALFEYATRQRLVSADTTAVGAIHDSSQPGSPIVPPHHAQFPVPDMAPPPPATPLSATQLRDKVERARREDALRRDAAARSARRRERRRVAAESEAASADAAKARVEEKSKGEEVKGGIEGEEVLSGAERRAREMARAIEGKARRDLKRGKKTFHKVGDGDRGTEENGGEDKTGKEQGVERKGAEEKSPEGKEEEGREAGVNDRLRGKKYGDGGEERSTVVDTKSDGEEVVAVSRAKFSSSGKRVQ